MVAPGAAPTGQAVQVDDACLPKGARLVGLVKWWRSVSATVEQLAHGLWFGLWGVSASRMVGVFMAATSTIGMRFDALPTWLSRLGLLLGAVLGLTGAFAGPLDFLFIAWLVVVSLTLLFSRRSREAGAAPAR